MRSNRVAAHAQSIREALAQGKRVDGAPLEEGAVEKLDATLAVTFTEHAAYQTAQARAHAAGVLTTEEAATIYRALGENYSESNGGWAKDTDLPLKVTVTALMGQLVARKGA